MLIVDFGRKHEACRDGIDRALALGHETMEAVWADERMNANDRIWTAIQPGVLTDRELRLFAVWCARQVQHLMTAAWDAAGAVARAAAWAAAWAAAGAAARDAARAAADAAWVAAGAAARDAARAAQSSYLLANTKPVFA